MTVPFTYIIKHLPTGKFYYGARWAKNCHPNDLWNIYFTSSEYVKNLLLEYGPSSFIYRVHKTFNSPEECIEFEKYFLKRIKVIHNDNFLNRACGNGYYNTKSLPSANKGKTNEISKGTKMYNNGFICKFFKEENVPDGWVKGNLRKPWNAGKTSNDDPRIKQIAKKSGETQKGYSPWNKGLKKSDHPSIEKYSSTLSIVNKGQISPSKSRIWYNNGEKNIRLKPGQEIPPDFVKGLLKRT